MKAYMINNDAVEKGIPVTMQPYPLIELGRGGHKRATWVPLGKQDAEKIIVNRMKPCPMQGQYDFNQDFTDDPSTKPETHICEHCGQQYGDWRKASGNYFARYHPKAGEVFEAKVVADVGALALKDKVSGAPTGKHLIVAPLPGNDNRILVYWSVSSGYRGGASISAAEDVLVIARDEAWHSGKGATGSTAQILAVLKPGQELQASRSGRRMQQTRGRLQWDGKEIKVTFGDENLFVAQSDNVDGDYV